jgi:hypothetical protein
MLNSTQLNINKYYGLQESNARIATTHHLRKDFQFPPKFKHIPFPPKLTCPNSQGYGARFGFTIYLSSTI